jgi:hypothetical protein
VTRNPTLVTVLSRAARLALPDWYLVAGCLYQTVWSVVTGQPPESGILDYDLAYFDSPGLSWRAEDAVIQEGHQFFGDLPALACASRAVATIFAAAARRGQCSSVVAAGWNHGGHARGGGGRQTR